MIRPARLLMLFAGLLVTACGSVGESEVLVEIRGTASTVTSAPPQATTSTTEPPDPHAGLPGADPDGCGPPGPEHTVFITESPDGSAGPCKVGIHQRLRFFNLTDARTAVRWAGTTLQVDSDSSATDPTPVGEVIEPGVYRVQSSPTDGPQIELVPSDVGFGAAQVSLRSFGVVRPGMSLAEAEAALDGTIIVQSRADMDACSPAWVTGDPYSPLLSVEGDAINPTVTRVEATSQSQLTLSGVGLGSSAEEVRLTYGDQLVSSPVPGGVERITFEPNGADNQEFRLVFDTKQGVVTSMRIGIVGSVERERPCS